MNNQLECHTIYYHEELDIDDSIIYVEWAEQARYKNGHLVRTIFDHGYAHGPKMRNESLAFAPD